LLKIEGYDGIKTGTTGAAGSCLVSTAKRDGQRLIIVVLGATSSDARYTDTRNLYRWAWNELVDAGSNAEEATQQAKAN
jgi:D-alanyl-D-alanine carboxypeptidase (penicillin-binding protein 5/6)